MLRKKIWIANAKQHLFALLPNECLFTGWKAIKERIQTTKGSSNAALTSQADHYVISEDFMMHAPNTKVIYAQGQLALQSPLKRRQRLEAFGLHTHLTLPHERLFLFRMLHLNALVWTRVNEKLQPMSPALLIMRNKEDMIIHNETLLSEIVLRQAEAVAARALYAFQVDVGSVLLAVSGSGTIAVREVYPLHKLEFSFDKEMIKRAVKMWSFNANHQQKLLTTDFDYSLTDWPASVPINRNIVKPFINSKIKVLSKPIVKLTAASGTEFQDLLQLYNVEQQSMENAEQEMVKVKAEQEMETAQQEIMEEQPSTLLIGADPELLFTDEKGNVVPAIDVLADDPLGRFGIDSIIVDQKLSFPVAELRPNPQETPQELLYELLNILQEMYAFTARKELLWLAGSMPTGSIALGGHLHFSGVELSSRLLRMLDFYVALPLSMIEDTRGKQRRPRYGALGDFRRQDYGGFEYRTLPSWLVSAAATKAALALSYIVVKEHAYLSANLLEDRKWIDAFIEGNDERLKPYCEAALKGIEACPSYEKLRSWIEPLQIMISSGQRWNEQRDIRSLWRLLPQEVH